MEIDLVPSTGINQTTPIPAEVLGPETPLRFSTSNSAQKVSCNFPGFCAREGTYEINKQDKTISFRALKENKTCRGIFIFDYKISGTELILSTVKKNIGNHMETITYVFE